MDFAIINKRYGHGPYRSGRWYDPTQPVLSVPVELSACTLWKLQTDFGDAYAVVVEQDAQVAGCRAAEGVGMRLAIFTDGTRVNGQELASAARELNLEVGGQLVVTAEGQGHFVHFRVTFQGNGQVVAFIALPAGFGLPVEHVQYTFGVGAGGNGTFFLLCLQAGIACGIVFHAEHSGLAP